jgi:hypothetical protein
MHGKEFMVLVDAINLAGLLTAYRCAPTVVVDDWSVLGLRIWHNPGGGQCGSRVRTPGTHRPTCRPTWAHAGGHRGITARPSTAPWFRLLVGVADVSRASGRANRFGPRGTYRSDDAEPTARTIPGTARRNRLAAIALSNNVADRAWRTRRPRNTTRSVGLRLLVVRSASTPKSSIGRMPPPRWWNAGERSPAYHQLGVCDALAWL